MDIKRISKSILKNIFKNFKKICKNKSTNDYRIRQYLFIFNYIKNIIDQQINNYNDINNDINNSDINMYIVNKITSIYFNSYNKVLILFNTYKQNNIIVSSILASMSLKLFKDIKTSCIYHLFYSKIVNFNIFNEYEKCINCNKNIHNNIQQPENAYPIDKRPRGDKDIESVNYQQSQIKNNNLPPIWILNKNNNMYILDGFHRISACFIQKHYDIKAYMITFNE